MLPLINIIFLLLAFFVLAGQIEVHHRKLSVPKSSSEIERASNASVLTILADGSMELDGRTLLPEELEIALSSSATSQIGKNTQTILVVADGNLLVSVLQETLNELMRLGVTKINLATLQSGRQSM